MQIETTWKYFKMEKGQRHVCVAPEIVSECGNLAIQKAQLNIGEISLPVAALCIGAMRNAATGGAYPK
jgi:hypothetical protein